MLDVTFVDFSWKNVEHMAGKIKKPEPNITNKKTAYFYRLINEFKKGYWPRINLVKKKKDGLFCKVP